MRKYLQVSLMLFGLALIITVIVWYLLQGMLFKNNATVIPENIVKDVQINTANLSSSSDQKIESDKNISLTPEQQQAAKSVGIDPESFTITDEMVDCAKAKLSESRMVEILNGDAPTVLETLTLLPCLRN